MNFVKKNLYKSILLSYALTTPISVLYAAVGGSGCDPTKQICNPITSTTINDFVKTILEGLLTIGIPIIALAIIYCGFLFVSARGNSEKITKAKDALLYTLIGAAVLIGSWAIAQLISNTVLAL